MPGHAHQNPRPAATLPHTAAQPTFFTGIYVKRRVPQVQSTEALTLSCTPRSKSETHMCFCRHHTCHEDPLFCWILAILQPAVHPLQDPHSAWSKKTLAAQPHATDPSQSKPVVIAGSLVVCTGKRRASLTALGHGSARAQSSNFWCSVLGAASGPTCAGPPLLNARPAS